MVVLGCIRDQQLEARDGAEARAHRWTQAMGTWTRSGCENRGKEVEGGSMT